MVESQHGPMDHGYGSGTAEECCTEKMVGSVSYTLLDGPFRGQIPHQCLNDCVYTVSGTSSPKFCFERGDLPTQCLSAEPEVSVTGGSSPNEGNIMIGGRPVCDDYWGQEDALVVCRQLGYSNGVPTENSLFGPVSTDFIYDDVQCNGNEEYIWECPHNPSHNCGSTEGAGVICFNDVGLVGGSGYNEGNVLVNGQPVCDDLWTQEDAMVVCRQLGYSYGEPTVNSFFGLVSTDFIYDDVQCIGDELYLSNCPHNPSHNCGSREGAGVICSNGEESGYGSGYGTTEPAPVNVAVLVKDASSNDVVADVSVEFTLGDLVLTETTNYEGVATFTLSSSHQGYAPSQGHQVPQECHRPEGDHPLQALHGRSGTARPGQPGPWNRSGQVAREVCRVPAPHAQECREQRRVQGS